MTINTVSVSVGETFPKKYTKYATWRTDIGYTASVDRGDNPNTVREELLKKANYDLKIMKESIYKEEEND